MSQPREKIRGKHPITDPYHRYEMEQLLIQHRKSRTVLPNIETVAKHLRRRPAQLLRWLGQRLNCGVVFPEELQGIHPPLAVREALYAYIQEFVLCPKCQLPETELVVTSTQVLCHKCQSCGKQMPVAPSRFTEWIIRDMRPA